MGDLDDFDNGWDIPGHAGRRRWVDRTPRRPEIEPQVRREVALMPWLAPRLPLPVPVPRDRVRGAAHRAARADRGRGLPGHLGGARSRVGSFLRAPALRRPRGGCPVRAPGTPRPRSPRRRRSATGWRSTYCPCCRRHVRRHGEALLARMACRRPTRDSCTATSGRAHPRRRRRRHGGHRLGRLRGRGPGPRPRVDEVRLAAGLRGRARGGVRPRRRVLARGLDWHLLGPWHEVLYGLDTDQPAYVEQRPRRRHLPPRPPPPLNAH